MNRAIDFWEKFLNQTVDLKDDIFSMFHFKGFHLGLFNNSKVNENVTWGDNCLLSFEVEDIEDIQEKLKGLGIQVVYPLTKIRDNWVLEFKDTEGNDIECYCVGGKSSKAKEGAQKSP